jgi:hypothetical protein
LHFKAVDDRSKKVRRKETPKKTSGKHTPYTLDMGLDSRKAPEKTTNRIELVQLSE